jgi:hypothetical protein
MALASSDLMLRTAFLCCIASSLVTACVAEDVPDELAGEGDDGEAGKDDASSAFTYFQVAADPSAHEGIEADTAGFFASRPNRATTACGASADAATQANCYARSIDWSGTGLADAVAKSYEARLRAGEPIILRGQLETERPEARDQRIAALASDRLAGTFSTELAASQPMIDVGGGPDCLFAQLNVNTVTVTTAKVSVSTPATGAAVVRGTFDGVLIRASAKFAVSCVNGTAPITIRIARLDLSGATPAVTGLVIEGEAQLPQPIDQMLALRDGRAADIVAQTAQLLVAPIVASESGPELQLAATEIWLPGHVVSGDDDLENVFVLAKTEDVKIREQRLNSTRSARITTIDFAASNADADVVTAARAALGGTGVLLAGPRVTRQGKTARSAERFWLRAE